MNVGLRFFSGRRWKLAVLVVAMVTTLIYAVLYDSVLNSHTVGTTRPTEIQFPRTTIPRPVDIKPPQAPIHRSNEIVSSLSSIPRPVEKKSQLTSIAQPMEKKSQLTSFPLPIEMKSALKSTEGTSKGSNLMIISYMRSGSSLNGDIFGKNPENFYVFEPLLRLAPSTYLTEKLLCEMQTRKCRADKADNNRDRVKSSTETVIVRDGMNISQHTTSSEPTSKEVSVRLLQEKTIQALKNIYNCNLTNLDDTILRSIMFEHWEGESKSGESWNNFTTCYVKLVEPSVTNMGTYLEHARTTEFNKHQHILRLLEQPRQQADMFRRCINELESHCRKTELRLTKVLRVSLRFLPSIMREIPDLKVLFIIRDPRGIINSRIQTRWYPIADDEPNLVRDNIESLCFKMQEDIKMIDSLKADFPGRFLDLTFESISEEPLQSFQTIFSFSGLKLTEAYSKKIKRVYSKRPTVVAKWSWMLKQKYINWTEEHCQDVLTKYSFNKYYS